MEEVLSERAGQLVIEKIGVHITLKLWFDTRDKYTEPHQRIPLFPEELDKLCTWWQKQKEKK